MLLSKNCHLSLPLLVLDPSAQTFWSIRGEGGAAQDQGGGETEV